MEQNYELTTARYFFELTKLFLQSIIVYYFKRDDAKLENLYYKTMDIHDQYIELYCDEEEKIERFMEKSYELLELISLKEQKDILTLKDSSKKYIGIKLRENIINNVYVEVWIIDEELWLYIFEKKAIMEKLIPFLIEDPYLISIDQIYYALKEKRTPGLLSKLYEKEKKGE